MTTVAGLTCNLPVAVRLDYGAGTLDDPYRLPSGPDTLFGGFVAMPSGQLLEDGSAQLASGERMTVAEPVLNGQSPGPAYDGPANRWVPAMNPRVVSPDGSLYVYPRNNGDGGNDSWPTTTIHVVTVKTGSDRLVYSSGHTDIPIAWTKDGIYVVDQRNDSSPDGLQLINPTTGSARLIESSRTWAIVANEVAWGTGQSVSSVLPYAPHEVDHLDVATGAVTRWYTVASSEFLWIVAVDPSGRPIVAVTTGSGDYVQGRQVQVFRLDSPSHAEPLFKANFNMYEGLFDSHGLWFRGDETRRGDVWFYSDSVGLHKVAEAPIGRLIEDVEGPCR